MRPMNRVVADTNVIASYVGTLWETRLTFRCSALAVTMSDAFPRCLALAVVE
jgi:hypothetical protein